MCSVRQARGPILQDTAVPRFTITSWRPHSPAANDNRSVDFVRRVTVAVGQVSVCLGSLSLLLAIALQVAR